MRSQSFAETTTGITILSVAAFLLILFSLIALRVKRTLEVRPGDIAAAMLPVILILLISGNIKSFEFGGLKVEAAIASASESLVATDAVKPSIDHIETSAKGGTSLIEKYRERKLAGLTFVLGTGRYDGEVIREYLSGIPSLRYLIFEKRDGTFFAIADASKIEALMSRGNEGQTFDDFARALNGADERALESRFLPTTATHATRDDSDRRNVLQQMDKLDLEVLPVVDARGRFAGIVSRSRLTSSILMDVVDHLKK